MQVQNLLKKYCKTYTYKHSTSVFLCTTFCVVLVRLYANNNNPIGDLLRSSPRSSLRQKFTCIIFSRAVHAYDGFTSQNCFNLLHLCLPIRTPICYQLGPKASVHEGSVLLPGRKQLKSGHFQDFQDRNRRHLPDTRTNHYVGINIGNK